MDIFTPSPPVISRHPTNPVGQTARIRRAVSVIRKHLRRVRDSVLAEFEAIPVTITNAPAPKIYEYQISVENLRALVGRIHEQLKNNEDYGLSDYALQSYREGIAKASTGLAGLSEDYSRDISRLLISDSLQRRSALVSARIFEEMEAFSGEAANELGRILFDGMETFENPRKVSVKLKKRFRIQSYRAERIARTEITMAHRRGMWDETRDSSEKLGLNTFLLHQSALIPGRTRLTHARRHGRIVTIEDQAEWYLEDGNGINCLCSASPIILGTDGRPISGKKVIERMRARKQTFLSTVI